MAWISDFRFAVRALTRRKGLSVAATLTLALGIAAATLGFTIVHGVLLRPLPYPEPERLVNLWQTNQSWLDSGNPMLRSFARRFPASWPVFEDWRDELSSLEAIGAYTNAAMTLTGGDHPVRLQATVATEGVFEALAVEPALGSTLEDRADGSRSAVLSHGLWQRHYAADPDILSRTIVLDGLPHAVVGVMPSGFAFPGTEEEIWVSLEAATRQRARGSQFLRTIGRLKPGVDLEAARQELAVLTAQLAEAYPDTQGELGARLVPRLEEVVGSTRQSLLALFTAVSLVLLVACANVANLLLVRSTTRTRELAVRAALGADRLRLTRLLTCESLVVALAGGLLGTASAALLLDPLLSMLPAALPRSGEIIVDFRMLLVATGVTLLAAIVAGLAPALGTARMRLTSALQTTGTSGGDAYARNRFQGLLVVVQLAIALILLVAAGLLGSSLGRLAAVDPGFDARNVVVAELALGSRKTEGTAVNNLSSRIRDRVRALPGVEAVALAEDVPFFRGSSAGTIELQAADGSRVTDNVGIALVSEGYFDTFGIPLITGRAFAPQDAGESPATVVISRAIAERHWPDVSPLGQRLRDPPEEHWRTVVGVVEDVRHTALAEPPPPRLYRPLSQTGELDEDSMVLAVRGSGSPQQLMRALRPAVWSVAPDVAIPRVARLASLVEDSIAAPRFRALAIGMLALVAAALAVIGVYGLIAFTVASRTAETGLRMALGATPVQIAREVMARAAALSLVSVLLGLPAAIMCARFLDSFLYEVKPDAPWIFGGAVGLVALAAVVASWLPAHRAARIQPTEALRYE